MENIYNHNKNIDNVNCAYTFNIYIILFKYNLHYYNYLPLIN